MLRLVAVISMLALLAGCSSLPGPEPAPNSWRLIGKLSLQTEHETRILGIDWTQTGDRSDIDLSGPLGVKVANVTTNNGELIVDTGKEVARYENDSVMSETGFVGLRLPWKTLSWWVRGVEGPAGPVIGEQGASRGNWHFRITESGIEGPRSMILEHPQVKLRLKVRKWSMGGQKLAAQRI